MFDIYVRNVAPMDEETAMGVCGLLPQIFGDAMDGYDESIPFYEKVKADSQRLWSTYPRMLP